MVLKKRRISNYIVNRYKEKKAIEDVISEKQQYLKPGKYKSISLGKTILYKDSNARKFIETLAKDWSASHAIIKLRIKELLANFFIIKIKNEGANTENKKQGDFALLTHSGNVKVFDTINGNVFHFIENREVDRLH